MIYAYRFLALWMMMILLLPGCAQLRYEFREHPMRTTLIVGGGLALGGYVIINGGDGRENQKRVFIPINPPCSNASCK